jgi:hypothetical protein
MATSLTVWRIENGKKINTKIYFSSQTGENALRQTKTERITDADNLRFFVPFWIALFGSLFSDY